MEKTNKNEKKKSKTIIVILVLLLAVCTGGYYGYNYYQQKQIEKIDTQIKQLKKDLQAELDKVSSVVEIKESEAESFDLDSVFTTDTTYTVEWDKELDRINSGSYTATVTALTESGNAVELKKQLSVLIEDDVKPEFNLSTDTFSYQVKSGEKFNLEMLNTIVGDVKDSKDGDIPYRDKAVTGKGYWFEVVTENVDFSKLKNGDKFEVKMIAQDNAGNRAEQTIRVVCSSEAADNPVAEKHEHKFGSWTTTKQPTCTAKGSKYRTCSECGYKETVSIDTLGHDVKWKTTNPTCTANGERTGKCSRCGNEVREPIKALGHDFRVTSNISPTCENAGYKEEKCSRCGETRRTEYAALGHNYSWKNVKNTAAQIIDEYTCSNCGKATKRRTKTYVVDQAAWDETVHHEAEYYERPVYRNVRYYVFQREDGSTVRYTMEQINAMGYVNASAYFDDHLDEFFRYYTQTEQVLDHYEYDLIEAAWDEVIHHPEVGHWEETIIDL